MDMTHEWAGHGTLCSKVLDILGIQILGGDKDLPTTGTAHQKSTLPRPQQHRGWLPSGLSGSSEPGERHKDVDGNFRSLFAPCPTHPGDTPPCYLLQCIALRAALSEC